MAHRGTPFEKVLSAGDRNDRFSVPASWRDQLLPQAPENGTASVRVLDDKGDWYNFVLKVRKNKTKPEFMAKGWKRFVRNRKLFPGDVIIFSRGDSPGTFRVRVIEVGPSLQLALAQSPPEPQPTPPTANLISHLSSAGSDAPPLPTASLFDPPADESDIGGGADIPEKMQAPSEGEGKGGACIRLFGKVISAA